MQVQATGMVWYEPDTFPQIRNMCEDPQNFASNYDEWLRSAETEYQRLTSQGARIIKVDMDPGVFEAWCAQQGIPRNGRARSNFVAHMARVLDPAFPL